MLAGALEEANARMGKIPDESGMLDRRLVDESRSRRIVVEYLYFFHFFFNCFSSCFGPICLISIFLLDVSSARPKVTLTYRAQTPLPSSFPFHLSIFDDAIEHEGRIEEERCVDNCP